MVFSVLSGTLTLSSTVAGIVKGRCCRPCDIREIPPGSRSTDGVSLEAGACPHGKHGAVVVNLMNMIQTETWYKGACDHGCLADRPQQ